MIETGTLLHERFLIEERIGVGGMGAVYRAVDQKFGSAVAVKETFFHDAELAEAFEREARLLNGLHHPIFPHVSDHFIENDGHFLVMEYIEGEDLSELLKRNEPIAFETVMGWTLDLLDGLDYLHSQEPPIIHRDIKPSNLKRTSRGNIVLLDFGMAKETSGNTQGMHSVFGYSRKYSPLEQIEGTGTDFRSDIFSLGATVFHLLTGTPPVDVLKRASAIVARRQDPLELASELNHNIPERVAAVISSALALDPDERFISAQAMRHALEHSLGREQVTSAAPVVVPVAGGGLKAAAAESSFPALEAFEAEVQADLEDSPAVSAFRSVTEDDQDPITAVVSERVSQMQTDLRPAKEKDASPNGESNRIVVPVFDAEGVVRADIQDLGAVDVLESAVVAPSEPVAPRPVPPERRNYLRLIGIPLLLFGLGIWGYALFRTPAPVDSSRDIPADQSEPSASPVLHEAPGEKENDAEPEESISLAEGETLGNESPSEVQARDAAEGSAITRDTTPPPQRTSNAAKTAPSEKASESATRGRNGSPADSGAKRSARARVVEDAAAERAPVSSIESIMTGIPADVSWSQRRREVLEEDQIRRERRQRRIDRRNRQNWPPF